jgi:hypothetical protein
LQRGAQPRRESADLAGVNLAAVTTLPLAMGFLVAMAAFFGWAYVSIAEQHRADATEVRRRRR